MRDACSQELAGRSPLQAIPVDVQGGMGWAVSSEVYDDFLKFLMCLVGGYLLNPMLTAAGPHLYMLSHRPHSGVVSKCFNDFGGVGRGAVRCV